MILVRHHLIEYCAVCCIVKDLLGLQELDSRGAIFFEQNEGDHMQFTIDWFVQNIVLKYLVD